ncbi:MAG: hypothetical protein EA359_09040 [Balneolaceae bacterium]|nr:MAG: hypothetical protein EA359_09040 [Balneolaceae bacterium]
MTSKSFPINFKERSKGFGVLYKMNASEGLDLLLKIFCGSDLIDFSVNTLLNNNIICVGFYIIIILADWYRIHFFENHS